MEPVSKAYAKGEPSSLMTTLIISSICYPKYFFTKIIVIKKKDSAAIKFLTASWLHPSHNGLLDPVMDLPHKIS